MLFLETTPRRLFVISVALLSLFTLADSVTAKLSIDHIGLRKASPKRHDCTYALAFRPDRNEIAGLHQSGVVKVWSVRTRKLLYSLNGREPKEGYPDVAYSPDGSLIAVGNGDLWNTVKRRIIRRLPFPSESGSISFSHDGKLLASAHGQKVFVWDVTNGKKKTELLGHTDRVSSLAFSPISDSLASGAEDHFVHIWDLKSSKPIFSFDRHIDFVTLVAFVNEGKTLVSGGADGFIEFYDVQTGRVIRSLEIEENQDLVKIRSTFESDTPVESYPRFMRSKKWAPIVLFGIAAISPNGQLAVFYDGEADAMWFVETRAGEDIPQPPEIGRIPDDNLLCSGQFVRASPVFNRDGSMIAVPEERSINLLRGNSTMSPERLDRAVLSHAHAQIMPFKTELRYVVPQLSTDEYVTRRVPSLNLVQEARFVGELGFQRNSGYLSNPAKALLDNIATELQNEPNSRLLIEIHTAANEHPNTSRSRQRSIKGYLSNSRGIDANRLISRRFHADCPVENGQVTSVWILPEGTPVNSIRPRCNN
jgi:WD40 repeat protein